MEIFNTEADLAAASLTAGQLVRTKGSTSADDGLSVLWRIAATGTGITLANGNVAIPVVNDKSGRKNLLINGGFDRWQRGTNFTSGTEYTADRWYIFANRTAVRSTDVPTIPQNQPVYSLAVSSVSTTPFVAQFYELPKAQEAGVFGPNQPFSLSFWIKASVGLDINLALRFVNNSGLIGAIDIIPETTIATSTGSWQKVTYSFITSGAVPSATNAAVQIGIKVNQTNETFNLTQVQMEQGPVATDFEYISPQQNLAECQRFYFAETRTLFMLAGGLLGSSTNDGVWLEYHFPVAMRASPTVVLGASQFVNTLAVFSTNETGVNMSGSAINASSVARFAGFTADAEL